MAYQTFQTEYLQTPPITRFYTTACVLTTLSVVSKMSLAALWGPWLTKVQFRPLFWSSNSWVPADPQFLIPDWGNHLCIVSPDGNPGICLVSQSEFTYYKSLLYVRTGYFKRAYTVVYFKIKTVLVLGQFYEIMHDIYNIMPLQFGEIISIEN